ncbi:hypothetical protein PMAYCL1PPCAC_19354, partial [Pristionchus mayeri]
MQRLDTINNLSRRGVRYIRGVRYLVDHCLPRTGFIVGPAWALPAIHAPVTIATTVRPWKKMRPRMNHCVLIDRCCFNAETNIPEKHPVVASIPAGTSGFESAFSNQREDDEAFDPPAISRGIDGTPACIFCFIHSFFSDCHFMCALWSRKSCGPESDIF